MTGTGRTLAAALGLAVAAGAAAAPPEPAPVGVMPAAPPPAAAPARLVLAEVVRADVRDAVLAVVKKPTIATRGTSDEVTCGPKLYDWLLDHPDRVTLAWRRLKVPAVEITDLGGGRFGWSDGDGSELTWETVGRFPAGRVWYATGKAKASKLAPMVPVRAVAVVSYPAAAAADGAVTHAPAVQAYLQTDSKAAGLVLRLLGPKADSLAVEGCEQLLFFFTGVARYCHAHPEKAEMLLGPKK